MSNMRFFRLAIVLSSSVCVTACAGGGGGNLAAPMRQTAATTASTTTAAITTTSTATTTSSPDLGNTTYPSWSNFPSWNGAVGAPAPASFGTSPLPAQFANEAGPVLVGSGSNTAMGVSF